ncbi:thiolase family protein [Oceanobacillus jeddahense]|uniref:thiolase family protein n=1 Tax=Oceanobacillus jeddahense TaxID=1462527 RepID=UPI00059609D4|nr:thiolase family protein [Oceanobacillus jeddahense]
MDKAVVLGVGMTKFGKYLNQSFKQLSNSVIDEALQDAEIDKLDIQAAFVSNVMAGSIWGQDSIRGQVFLSESGLQGIPVHNVENACASGSSAIQLAKMAVESGMHDVVLVLGVEKMIHPNKSKSFDAFQGATDVENFPKELEGEGESKKQSMFMNLYAEEAQRYMDKYGLTIETLSKVAVKNSYNGSLNPNAHYQKANSLEAIMTSRLISTPLRLLMCSPLSDGAAATIICSEKYAKKHVREMIYIKSSVVLSGQKAMDNEVNSVTKAATIAYDQAGLGPKDLGVVEVHDAAVSGELWAYEQLQLCEEGEAGSMIEEGTTEISGKIPVNTSGGLISRGHPIGATGIAQLAEVYWQLKGEAGDRQIKNKPKVGLTQNVGGFLYGYNGAVSVHIFER